jgi:hypothetical protein
MIRILVLAAVFSAYSVFADLGTIVNTSGVPVQFDLSTLEITFSGSTLITNKEYSSPLASIREITFDYVVSNNVGVTAPVKKSTPLRYVDGSIIFEPSVTGAASVRMFNARGQLVASLFEGVVVKGSQAILPVKKVTGTYFIKLTAIDIQETYVIRIL